MALRHGADIGHKQPRSDLHPLPRRGWDLSGGGLIVSGLRRVQALLREDHQVSSDGAEAVAGERDQPGGAARYDQQGEDQNTEAAGTGR